MAAVKKQPQRKRNSVAKKARKQSIFDMRNASIAVIVLVLAFSIFSIANAQTLLKKDPSSCEGFWNCTSMYFESLWQTLAGNPTASTNAQISSGIPEFGGVPPPAPADPVSQDQSGVVVSGTSVKQISWEPIYEGTSTAPMGSGSPGASSHSLILQPNGTDTVVIGQGQTSQQYKLDIFGMMRAQAIEGSWMTLTGGANVSSLSASYSISTPMLCLGSSSITCPTSVEEFGPWKKATNGGIYFTSRYVKNRDGDSNDLSLPDCSCGNEGSCGESFVSQSTDTTNECKVGFNGFSTSGVKVYKKNPGIGVETANPSFNASLDMSGAKKGFLPPKLQVNQEGLAAVDEGLTIYNTSEHKYKVWTGSVWDDVGGLWKKVAGGSDIFYTGGKVGIGDIQKNLSTLSVKGLTSYTIARNANIKEVRTFTTNLDSPTVSVIRGLTEEQLNNIAPGDTIVVTKEDGASESRIVAGIGTYQVPGTSTTEKTLILRPYLSDSFRNATNLALEITPNIFRLADKNNSTKLSVNASGNVGVGGVNTNRAILEVKGAIDSTMMILDPLIQGTNVNRGLSLIGNWPGIGFNMYRTQNGATTIGTGYTSSIWGDPAYGGIDMRTSATSAEYRNTQLAENRALLISKNGNVGIGDFYPGGVQKEPGASLQIAKMGESIIVPAKLTCGQQTLDGGLRPAALLFSFDPAGGCGDYAYIAYEAKTSADNTDKTVLKISTGNDVPNADGSPSSGQDDIALMPKGYVGIGTTDPGFMLDVKGDINVRIASSGNTTVQNDKQKLALADERIGFDVAELFDTEERVEVGDVLVVGSTERKLKKSSQPYQNAVVGVVSGAPAILFEGSQLKMGTSQKGSDHERKPAVALTGKVPVKVSLENGAINIGDYLTTSSRPGLAMKATKQGMTIGVALESYNGKGKNEVLTFLSIKESNTSEALQELSDRLEKVEKNLKKK